MLEWAALLAFVLVLVYFAVQLRKQHLAYEQMREEFHEVLIESGIEVVYMGDAYPPPEVAFYESMRGKIAQRHLEPSSLKVGEVAFRKGKPCRVEHVDLADDPPSLTVKMLEDNSVVGTEMALLQTAVGLCAKITGAGPGSTYPMTDEVPWARFLADEEKKMLSTSLTKRAAKMAFLMMQLQQDKPGIRQLWTQKRITDDYWESLNSLEQLLGEDLQALQADAERISPGLSKQVMQLAVQEARRMREEGSDAPARANPAEAPGAKAPGAKAPVEKPFQESPEMAKQRQEAELRRQEELKAQKMAEELIAAEDEEKKKPAKAKKKK